MRSLRRRVCLVKERKKEEAFCKEIFEFLKRFLSQRSFNFVLIKHLVNVLTKDF